MSSYARQQKNGVGTVALLVVLAVAVVGAYFFFKNGATHNWGFATPAMPTTTAPPPFKGNAALHKTFKRYVEQGGFEGSYKVSRPSSKTFLASFRTTTTDDNSTSRMLAAAMCATYLYLKAKHASPNTVVKLTLTNSLEKTYDLRVIALGKAPKFKEIDRFVTTLTEK